MCLDQAISININECNKIKIHVNVSSPKLKPRDYVPTNEWREPETEGPPRLASSDAIKRSVLSLILIRKQWATWDEIKDNPISQWILWSSKSSVSFNLIY